MPCYTTVAKVTNVTSASVVVEGLNVCGAAASGEKRWVKIPTAFSRDELQVDAEDIATTRKNN